MDVQKVHTVLSDAVQRCVALRSQGSRLKEDGNSHEATVVLEKAQKLQAQIAAVERALQGWRRT